MALRRRWAGRPSTGPTVEPALNRSSPEPAVRPRRSGDQTGGPDVDPTPSRTTHGSTVRRRWAGPGLPAASGGVTIPPSPAGQPVPPARAGSPSSHPGPTAGSPANLAEAATSYSHTAAAARPGRGSSAGTAAADVASQAVSPTPLPLALVAPGLSDPFGVTFGSPGPGRPRPAAGHPDVADGSAAPSGTSRDSWRPGGFLRRSVMARVRSAVGLPVAPRVTRLVGSAPTSTSAGDRVARSSAVAPTAGTQQPTSSGQAGAATGPRVLRTPTASAVAPPSSPPAHTNPPAAGAPTTGPPTTGQAPAHGSASQAVTPAQGASPSAGTAAVPATSAAPAMAGASGAGETGSPSRGAGSQPGPVERPPLVRRFAGPSAPSPDPLGTTSVDRRGRSEQPLGPDATGSPPSTGPATGTTAGPSDPFDRARERATALGPGGGRPEDRPSGQPGRAGDPRALLTTGGPGSLIRRVVGGPAAAGTRPGVSEQSLRPGHPAALARVFGAGATPGRTILVPAASGVGGRVHAVVRRSIGVAARSYAGGGVPARWRSAAIVPARSTLFAGPGVAIARPLATLLTGHPAAGSAAAGSAAAGSAAGGSAAGRPDATASGAGSGAGSTAGRALDTAAGHAGVGSTADGVLGTGTRTPARSAIGATAADRPDHRRATGRSGPPSPGTPIRRRFSPTLGRIDPAPRIVASGATAPAGSAGSSGRTSLVLAGLPAAVTGTAARRRPLTDIAVAPSAATTPVGPLASAFSAVARWGDSLIRRRRGSDVRAGFDEPAADRSWTSRSLGRSSTRTPTSAVTASAAPAAHRSRARPLHSVVVAGAPDPGRADVGPAADLERSPGVPAAVDRVGPHDQPRPKPRRRRSGHAQHEPPRPDRLHRSACRVRRRTGSAAPVPGDERFPTRPG